MSLRAKLIWGFILVALGALLLAFATSNLGLYSSLVGMRRGMGGMGMGMGTARRPVEILVVLRTALRWSLWSSLVALTLAGALGVVTAGRITKSLRGLRDAAAQLDLRDLSRRVPVVGNDEIAELATAFNRMCDRLEADERSRRQFLADTAHELRHPLAVLRGHVDLMQDGKVELTPESLLPIQDEIIRLTRLVNDLRELSLAEVGKLSLHLTTVEPSALLSALFANMGPVAAAKEIHLTSQVEPDLPPLVADPDRLSQVLLNLLTNAIHYTPPGGQIQVAVGLVERQLQISVTDSGPGISPEDLPHIFDRFYRADKARSRGTGGSGLGLAIARSLVELHGGQIGVESREGQGSRFTLRLPIRSV